MGGAGVRDGGWGFGGVKEKSCCSTLSFIGPCAATANPSYRLASAVCFTLGMDAN